jgi:HSP20 family protein
MVKLDDQHPEDRRKNLRDVMDELDRYFEELEKELQDSVRHAFGKGTRETAPFVGGFSMQVGPDGPAIQFFGDDVVKNDGYRVPLSEQILEEKSGVLKVVMDLPGIDKQAIEVSATDSRVVVEAVQGERKYRGSVELKAEVDPNSGRAEYNNGVLEISFSLREKSNKGARRVNVV